MSGLGRYRVIGSIGPELSAPLLVEALGDGDAVAERVVLDRVRPEPVHRQVRQAGCPMAVAQRSVLTTEQGSWAVVPHIPGVDLVELREHFGEGAPQDVAVAVLLEVILALQRVADVGAHHGDLKGASVRIGQEGVVRVIGWRGGTERDDCRALADLFELLCGETNLPAAVRLDWPGTLAGVRARLQDPGLSLRARIGPIAAAHVQGVAGHPLTGSVVSEVDAHNRLPGKVRLAAVGAVTLLLGIAISYFLTGMRL